VDEEIAAIAAASTRRAGERGSAAHRALARTTPYDAEDRRVILGAMGSFADAALLRRALGWTLAERVKPETRTRSPTAPPSGRPRDRC
jgi:hypothetical protein